MNPEIKSKLESVRWFHAFEVLPGVISPGFAPFNARGTLDALGVPDDLTGKKALDVGTWDGPMAFEMEARGAEVWAVDVQHPDCTAFNTAKALRNSQVRYHQGTVYDLQKIFQHKFDLITYFGVYYHLKHPILGFEALAEVLAPDGQLYFEGELLVNYAENYKGEEADLDHRALAESDVPLSLCYTGDYKGASNWFVPNLTCLRGWLEAAGLEMVYHSINADDSLRPHPRQRVMGTAVKSGALEQIDEIGIFEGKLELPEDWSRRTTKLLSRRKADKKWRPKMPPSVRGGHKRQKPGWAKSIARLLRKLGG
jgi:SAM-dependent methyltransferase